MGATIYIPEKYKALAERLARKKTTEGERPIFETYVDLMVFAAMIGYSLGESDEVKSSDRGPEIYSEIFENRRQEGVGYLLAIHEHRSGEILRKESENQAWQVMEGYASRGLREIEDWLNDAAGDIDGVSTLLNRMKEKYAGRAESEGTLNPDINW